jgi:hypothetical protein
MITFEHTSGIGINANYRIRNAQGAVVATVARTGRSHWRIASVHYHHTLGTYGSLDRAREAAQALAYPTAKEVYDLICSEVGEHRRIEKVTAHAADFERLARSIIAGSNSARAELETLLAQIDAYTTDRTDTRAARQAKCDRDYEATGRRTYVLEQHGTLYPEPPTKVEA